MRLKLFYGVGSYWLLCVGLAGCNAILGIEAARVDPRLTVKSSAPSASAAVPDGATSTSTDGGKDAGADDGSVVVATSSSASAPSASMDLDAAAWVADVSATTTQGMTSASTAPTLQLDASMSVDAYAPEAGGDAAASGPEPEMCETYCAEIMELCTDGLKQYRDQRQCEKVCELLPEGEIASTANENSVACRLRYASKARYAAGTELDAYCRQAGPGGDGRCGSNCEGYCSLTMSVCTDESAGIYHFDNATECLEECEALPISSVSYTTTGTEVSDGNHVQCRLFHVTSAAMLDAEEHCEHALGLTLCESSDP